MREGKSTFGGSRKPKPVSVAAPESIIFMGEVLVGRDTSPQKGCRFIAGEPSTFERMCGKPLVKFGSFFCAEHHALCWTKQRSGLPFVPWRAAGRAIGFGLDHEG